MQQEDNLIEEEREEGILRFVEITIVRQLIRPDGSRDYYTQEILFRYDMPRAIYERRKWVITWRVAKFQCQFPKFLITPYHRFYNRKAAIPLWKIPLDKLVSAIQMVTQIKGKMADAKKEHIPSLYDPTIETSPHWIKAEDKLERYRLQVEYYTTEVEPIKNNPPPKPIDKRVPAISLPLE